MNRRKRTSPPLLPARRNLVLLALFGLGAVALEGKLAWLHLKQEANGKDLVHEAQARQFDEITIPVRRGMFTDRNGEPLAISTPVENIWVNPQEISGDRDAIFALARALDINGDELERKITGSADRKFLYVERAMSPPEAADILELGITGVDTEDDYKRYWPMAEIPCQLIGFTGIDDTGSEGGQGLERDFDADLTGAPGKKLVQRDARRRLVADIEERVPARPGADIRLSIDMALQYPAYRSLKTVYEETGAKIASLVMLDARTGEVLVMANQPSCNPNDNEQKDDLESFRNFAIRDLFEPGSTIKPLILAAALENGLSPDARIHIEPDIMVGTQLLEPDLRADPNGDTLTNILARSSNPGMVTITRDHLDAAVMWQMLKNFGLAGPTGSGLGGGSESLGTLDNYQLWGSVRKDTVSYGYGLSVTALQLARAYAAIAGGGLLPPISYVALDEPPQRVRIMREETAAALVQMLEGVVTGEQATARRAAIPNYTVAGKTGTIRILGPAGYSSTRHTAVFAGFAPASRPRFVMVIVIAEPRGGEYYGGEIAAPLFSEVMGKALRLYGVQPDNLPEPEQLTSSLTEDRR